MNRRYRGSRRRTNSFLRDTRSGDAQRQRIGIELEQHVGEVELRDNRIEAATAVKDGRNADRQRLASEARETR
jgi:hypothetical protein